MMPKAVLLGRPNVGKSTLFNRLIRSNRAITHDMPGVTRDRMEGVVRGQGKEPFALVDTGGVTLDGHEAVAEGPKGIRGFEADILRQAEEALAEADMLCLVVDGREGLTPFDEHLAARIRRVGKPVLVVVNKVDGLEKEDQLLAEFHALGFPLLAVSGEHGHNIRALEEEIRERLPELDLPAQLNVALDNGVDADDDLDADDYLDDDHNLDSDESDDFDDGDACGPEESTEEFAEDSASALDGDTLDPMGGDVTPKLPKTGPLRLCLLGRPNAGKSSLVNAFIGKERMIVSDVAGTTRDSVDIPLEKNGKMYMFVDTAGVRRRSRITDTVERYSVNSSLKSTTKAHVTLLALDATEGLTSQDKRLIELLDERKTPFMILLNKTDLIQPRERAALKKQFSEELSFCPHVPVLSVSAKAGAGLSPILPLAEQIRTECSVRISTGQLNRAMEAVLTKHQAPVVRRVRPKFFYLTQAESEPPTFVFFVNDADRVAESYVRYLEKALRRMFGILHAPMRVRLRSSHTKKSDTRKAKLNATPMTEQGMGKAPGGRLSAMEMGKPTAQHKPAPKSSGNAGVKSGAKTTDYTTDYTADYMAGSSADNATGKVDTKATGNTAATASGAKVSGDTAGKRSRDTSSQSTEKPSGKPSGKASGKSSGRPTSKTSGKPARKPANKAPVKPAHKNAGKTKITDSTTNTSGKASAKKVNAGRKKRTPKRHLEE